MLIFLVTILCWISRKYIITPFIPHFDDSMIDFVKYEGIDVFIECKKSFLDTEKMLKRYDLGLKLSGSNELRPGYKDYNNISDILNEISIPT